MRAPAVALMSDELDRAITAVTELAEVPENALAEFRRQRLAIIDWANLRYETLENIGPPMPTADIARFLNPVIAAARKLDAALLKLQDASDGAALAAAARLASELTPERPEGWD